LIGHDVGDQRGDKDYQGYGLDGVMRTMSLIEVGTSTRRQISRSMYWRSWCEIFYRRNHLGTT
jgi:hypothetical protein